MPNNQEVAVDPVDLSRSLALNFSRYDGTFGSVILTYSIVYDEVSLQIVCAYSIVKFYSLGISRGRLLFFLLFFVYAPFLVVVFKMATVRSKLHDMLR